VIANFGTLSLTNSTLAENRALFEAGMPRFRPVISSATNARTFLQNTILTHNAEDTFVQDCFGPITSLGNNLISDTAGCAIDPTAMALLSVEQRAEVEQIRQGPRPKGWRARFRYEHLTRESQMMVARTVAIDADLHNAAAPQVVILGAWTDGLGECASL
jgi:hypothetical protein